jgi:hypothetical protein
MKGFSHFMSGVAVASFCPWAIDAALQGNPLFFVLGGACGILPDTLDFKVYRFFYDHDVYVTPDPGNLDPQYIADETARAINMAFDEKRYIRLKLVSIRLGADFWQQYIVKFDNEKNEVLVKFGPVVTTGQVTVEGTETATRPWPAPRSSARSSRPTTPSSRSTSSTAPPSAWPSATTATSTSNSCPGTANGRIRSPSA